MDKVFLALTNQLQLLWGPCFHSIFRCRTRAALPREPLAGLARPAGLRLGRARRLRADRVPKSKIVLARSQFGHGSPRCPATVFVTISATAEDTGRRSHWSALGELNTSQFHICRRIPIKFSYRLFRDPSALAALFAARIAFQQCNITHINWQ